MGVSLNCPNCGALIGEANHENNYIKEYYFRDNNGKPTCNNCKPGESDMIERKIYFISLVVILLLFILLQL